MKRQRVDLSEERSVIISAITSTPFLRGMGDGLAPELLESTYARMVCGWVLEHFTKYGEAPEGTIQDVYRAHLPELREEQETGTIADFLSSLSKEMERKGAADPAYAVDAARKYLRGRARARRAQRTAEAAGDEVEALRAEADCAAALAALEGGGGGGGGPGLVLRRGSEIEVEPVRWLWKDRLPLGKLTILFGNGGAGKSTLACFIVAAVTAGIPWPDRPERSNARTGQALLLSAEDGAGDTLKPRLADAGADHDRYSLIESVRRVNPKSRQTEDGQWFDLGGDLPFLETVLKAAGDVRLLVVDPVSAYLGPRVDSWKDADVRRVLGPLSQLADRYRLAVLAIIHPNKNEGTQTVLHRINGSGAFGNAARLVHVVGIHPDDTDKPDTEQRRVLACVKSNLCAKPPSLAFRIGPGLDGAAAVRWETDAVDATAAEVMGGGEKRRGERKPSAERLRAAAWLADFLEAGPRPAEECLRAGEAAGYPAWLLKEVKARAGARSVKHGMGAGWDWTLEETETGA